MFRWTVLDLRTCYSLGTLHLWIRTNRTCFNVLRWTSRSPVIATTFPERRGIPHEFKDKILSGEWRDIPQNEPGITVFHTFTWPSWPVITTRNYLFTAIRTPYEPASHSGLYTYTSPKAAVFTPIYSDNFTTLPCGRP